ncbi:hypothetical protein MMC28_003631 [Mycoblastus sanguinarius]|nr:hypothetical protein [Mycoblastus sanguinarius]
MASATGIPEENPAIQGNGEDEPLLGRAGDASQQDGNGIGYNFVLGEGFIHLCLKLGESTAIIAQAGIWLLTATVWASVFIHPLSLFSAHPVRLHLPPKQRSYSTNHHPPPKLLNSAGILLTTQAILVLQPTHAPKQKRTGTYIHSALNGTSILTLLAGLIVIEYNKISHAGTHFESPHAILGLITYIVFLIQAIVGITQYYTPSLYGGEGKAKSVWKYHRMSGYVLLVLSFATVAAATQTGFNKMLLHIKLWPVIVTAVITLVGILPRIKKQKLGL